MSEKGSERNTHAVALGRLGGRKNAAKGPSYFRYIVSVREEKRKARKISISTELGETLLGGESAIATDWDEEIADRVGHKPRCSCTTCSRLRQMLSE